MTDIGSGNIDKLEVTPEGDVVLKVLGKDAIHGHWALFYARITWSHWIALNEQAYNDREDIAQQHIPGT